MSINKKLIGKTSNSYNHHNQNFGLARLSKEFIFTFMRKVGQGRTWLKSKPLRRLKNDLCIWQSWIHIGETDDPNAITQTFECAAAITKGEPVYLFTDDKINLASHKIA